MNKKMLFWFLVLALAIGIRINFGGLPGKSMHDNFDGINQHLLIAESEAMLRAFHRTGKTEGKIPSELWRESIRKLNPRLVRTLSRGVLIQERRSLFRQEGLYVQLDFLPYIACEDLKFTRGDTFTPIVEHLDWVDLSLKSE